MEIHRAEPHLAPRLAALKLLSATVAYARVLDGHGFEEWVAYYCTGTRIVESMDRRDYFYLGEPEHPEAMIGLELDGKQGVIRDLYVRPENQRQGRGKELLEFGLDELRRRGAVWAAIELFVKNGAGRRLVEEQSFAPAERFTDEASGAEVIRYMQLIASDADESAV